MALDAALEQAVSEATEKAGQPRSVAQRLVAWLQALSDGGSSEEQDLSFYANVMSALQIGDGTDAG